jgi:hypothetical protein
MSADWIPVGSLGVISSVVAWLVAWRVSAARSEGRSDAQHDAEDAKDTSVKQDIRDLRNEVRATMEELRTLGAATVKLSASQDVVNSVTSKALESIIGKMDRHEEKLADHASTLKLLTEVVMARSKVMPPGPCPLNCPFGPQEPQGSPPDIKKELRS